MPTYTAICPNCKHEIDYFRKIADRNETPVCECGTKTEKIITACQLPIMAISETMHVVSPIDGTVMRSRYDYEAHMKKHNVVPQSDLAGHKVTPKDNKKEIAEAVSQAYDKVVGL